MNSRATNSGRVYLIGAGPGDPKLLTIKAAEIISRSDVIVYDYLVNPEVLQHARRGVELIYAGKRAGQHSMSQTELNNLLIERARRGQCVSRLKGGDPFIFGRGGEEAQSLADAGIEWEVVPGISSGVAAPAYAGIPLTHRDHASSVTFITGHDSINKRKQPIDWSAHARAADTIVIFMCAETISTIARELIDGGRAPQTPIAIIRWGTYEHQEIYQGALHQIAFAGEGASEIEGIKIEPPAIAIIGDVVSLMERLRWFARPAIELESARKELV